MAGPIDYLSGLGGIQGLSNPTGALMNGLFAGQDRQFEMQKRQLMMQQIGMKAEADRRALEREKNYQDKVAGFLSDPSAQNAATLSLMFPDKAQEIKSAWELRSEEAQKADLKQVGGIFSALNAGRPDLAKQAVEQRLTAEKEAGRGDGEDAQTLEMLQEAIDKDPKKATGLAGFMLASIVGPEKYASVLEQTRLTSEPKLMDVAPGSVVIDERTGNEIYASPYKPQIITGPNGEVIEYTPTGGGGGSPQIPATGSAIESAALSAVPGATVTSRQRSPEKNKSVGGNPNSFHLTDQARDFVPPKGMTMAALAAQFRQAMPGFDVINEGDHVHVEPSSRGSSGGMRQLTGGKAPKGPEMDPKGIYQGVKSQADYNALPSGAQYRAPDGTLRRKG